MQTKNTPTLNLYCYRIQMSTWTRFSSMPPMLQSNALSNAPTSAPTQTNASQTNASQIKTSQSDTCKGQYEQLCNQPETQWFDLTFLVSVSGYAALTEQHLISNILSTFSGYHWLPEEFLAPLLRGKGQLPMTISTEAVPDDWLFWQVLRSPLRLALHITITAPFALPLG